MHTLAFIYSFLAINANTMLRNFSTLRRAVLQYDSVFVSVAAMLAAFFITIKLVRFSTSLMSDEQAGGHGGISVSSIMIPIGILVCICGYNYFIGGLDWCVRTVVNTITTDVDNLANNNKEAFQGILETIDETEKALLGKDSLESTLDGIFEGARDEALNGTKSSDWDFQTANKLVNARKEELNKYSDDGNLANSQLKALKRLIVKYMGAERKANSDEGSNRGLFGSFIFWLFGIMYRIIQALAEILLCIMALLGPIVLAFSLLDPWRKAFISYIGNYITVSFWLVTASIIDWLVNLSTSKVLASGRSDYLAQAQSIIVDGTDAQNIIMTASQSLTTSTFIFIAGIIALLSVPDITSTILGLGGGFSGVSGKGGQAAQTGGLAPGKMTEKGAGMLIGK